MADSLDHLSSRTRIEWLSSLNTEFVPKKNYRRTSIICTIGPKTNSSAKINILRKAGLNVVRMNFSHGAYEYHQSVIDNAHEAERLDPGRPLAIALDTVSINNRYAVHGEMDANDEHRKGLRSVPATPRTMQTSLLHKARRSTSPPTTNTQLHATIRTCQHPSP